MVGLWQQDDFRNILQIEPLPGVGLSIIVQGNWWQNLGKIENFRARLGDQGIATAAAVTRETGQPGFTTPGAYSVTVVLENNALRKNNFAAVRALLDGIDQDLGIKGADADFSQGNVYARVVSVAGLSPDEYVTAFRRPKNEVDQAIVFSTNPPDEITPFAGKGLVLPAEEPILFKRRPEAPVLDRKALRQQSIDSDVEVSRLGKNSYFTISFSSGESSISAYEAADREAGNFANVARKMRLKVLGQEDTRPSTRLQNTVVIQLDSKENTRKLVLLLQTKKSLSPEKLKEITDAAPEGWLPGIFKYVAHALQIPSFGGSRSSRQRPVRENKAALG